MSTIKYTMANIEISKVEYKDLLNNECINAFDEFIEPIKQELNQAFVDSCDKFDELSIDTTKLVPFVSDSEYTAQIKELDLNIADRKQAWQYRRLSIRDIQIEAIIYASKKKFNNRIKNSLQSIYEGFVRVGRDQVSLGSILNSVTKTLQLKDEFKPSSCDTIELDKVNKQSIAFQFITCLSEMGMLDIFISDKTHMIKFNERMEEHFNLEAFNKLVKLNKFINAKTIVTDEPEAYRNKMLSQTSWYYDTPEPSKELTEYFSIVQGIKYRFKDFCGEQFIQSYKSHCQINELKDYDKERINFLWEQVEASRNNDGHYVNCQGDSVFRNYMMAEFGHFQTSHSFRDLVTVDGINEPVKYDATNSVLQMYALALKSGNLGQYVGLLENKTGDFRTIIADKLNTKFDTDAFTKDKIKPVFMIWAYNAGKDRILEGNPKEIVDPFDGSIRLDFTNRSKGLLSIAEGVNYKDKDKLFDAFISILENTVPEILFLKSIFKKLVKGNPQELYTWTLPDGTKSQYANVIKDKELIKDTVEAIDSDGDKHIHTVYNKSLQVSNSLAGLLPRVIHSIDAYIQREIVVRSSRLGIVTVPNHDSFMFDKQYQSTMFNLIKEVYADVMDGRVLQNIVRELNQTEVDSTIKNRGIAITSEDFWNNEFGELTREDIMKGSPVEEEEI